MQHVNTKIFAREPAPTDLGDAIPIFHRWIQESVCEELLIDVADYRHVPAGPGVVLVGHEANYSLDLAENRLGLLYNRKAVLDGTDQDRLLQAFYAALVASKRLEEEEAFREKLHFDAGRAEVILNDRLLSPNTEATWDETRPEFERFFDALYGKGAYTLERIGEPRQRFRVRATARTPLDVRSLIEAVQHA